MSVENHTLCFVNGMHLYAGAEVWMLEAATSLRDRGRTVHFVAPPGSPLLERARAAGFHVAGIDIRFDASPFTLARLWTEFRHTRPAAVVCNRLKDLKAAGVAGALAGVPIRLYSRESDFPLRSTRPYYRWYLNKVATGLLVNSDATRRTTLASAPWLDLARVHTLLKGVDLLTFQPTPRNAGIPTVGFAGQLSERKGLTTLMKAWETLRTRNDALPAARLLIAGQGELREELCRWRDGLSAPAEVELLGQVDAMPAFYASLDVLALPSRYEGYGLTAAEALACGRPVVACDTSSMPELVSDGCSGRLVPIDRPDLVADALHAYLVDPDLAAVHGAAGRAAMVAGHDREQTLDQLDALTTPKGSS